MNDQNELLSYVTDLEYRIHTGRDPYDPIEDDPIEDDEKLRLSLLERLLQTMFGRWATRRS